jgi:Rrf2 family protein
MKLSQSVTYAIHAVLRLAQSRDGTPISCGKLAEEGKMPERFLLQILRDLAKQGILQSTRGGGGGFNLGRRATEITLLDLIEAVDGPVAASLPLKSGFPVEAGERLREALKRIAEVTRGQLHAIKIGNLVGPNGLGE